MKNIIIWSNENQQEQKGPWDSWPTELTPYHRYIDAILEKIENGDYNNSQHLSADEDLIGGLVRQLAPQKWWKKTYDPRPIEVGDIVSTVEESTVRDDDGNFYQWQPGNRLRVESLLNGSLGVLPASDKLYLTSDDDGSKVVFTAEEFLEKFCSERKYAVISLSTVELTERANPVDVDGPTNLEVFKKEYLDPAPNELQPIFKKMADWFVKKELYEDSFPELVYSAPFLKWHNQYGDKNFIDPEYDLNLNDPDLTIESVYEWATALGKAGLDPKENKIQWDSKPTWVNSGEDANQDTITVLDLDDWDEILKHGSAMEHCYAVEDSSYEEKYKNLLERPDVKYLAIRSKTGRSKGGVFIGIKGAIDEEHPFGSEIFPIEAKSGGRSGQQPLDFRHPTNPTYKSLNNFYSFLKEKGVSVDEKIVNVGYAYENRMFPIQDEDREPEHLDDQDDFGDYYADIEVHSLDDLDSFFFSLKNDSQWFGYDEDPEIQYADNGDYWYLSANPVRVNVDPLAVCNELYEVIAEEDIKDYTNQDFFMLQLATLIAACEYSNQSSLNEYRQAKVIIESLIGSLQHDFPDSPGIQVTMTNAREYVEDGIVTAYEHEGGKPLLRSIMRYKTYVEPLPEQVIEDDAQGNSRFFNPDTQNDQGTFFYPQGTPTKQAEEEKSWNKALERINGDPERIYEAIQAFPNIMQSAGFASYDTRESELILVALSLAAKQGFNVSLDQYHQWIYRSNNLKTLENWSPPPPQPEFNQQREYQQNRQNVVNANTIKIWEKDSALKDLPPEDAEKIIAAIKDAMAKNDFDKIELLKNLVDRLTVQYGGQIEVTAAMQKASDYFYDWQGYYPDDGSLDDGVVKPSGPGPAYMNMPSRSCPKCDGTGELPAGHMINFDEYDKLNINLKVDLSCPTCGYNWPMEYDKLMGEGQRWQVLNKTIEARGPHKPKQFTQTAPTVQGPEGKPYIVVYRGMSDKEYKEWQSGDPINAGKYFTSMPHKFFVDPNIIKQTDEHTYTFVNAGILQGEYIKAIAPSAFEQPAAPKIQNQMFARTNEKESFNQGMQMESSYIDLDVRAKIVNANLKEFPNYYDRIASFKKMAEDPDKFSEVDLQSPPYGGSQPYLNKDMPNPMGPAMIDIQKKRKPDHKPVVIEPEIVDIVIEAQDDQAV